MARQLQPEILINDRVGTSEDFVTPENVVAAQDQAWESCFTMNRTWGYAPCDRNYKPVHEVIRLLASCASQQGNLLLNVSPDGDGRIPIKQVEILRKVGRCLQLHGAAIYGAGPSPGTKIDSPSQSNTSKARGAMASAGATQLRLNNTAA